MCGPIGPKSVTHTHPEISFSFVCRLDGKLEQGGPSAAVVFGGVAAGLVLTILTFGAVAYQCLVVAAKQSLNSNRGHAKILKWNVVARDSSVIVKDYNSQVQFICVP